MGDGIDGVLLALALGLGAGLSPVAPGTMGSLIGLLPAWGLSRLKPAWHATIIAVLGAFGVWLCGTVASRIGEKDPGMIVYDEIVGLFIALFRLPWRWQWLVPAFLLYRAFDILKPWPVSAAEEWFGVGGGIMADDAIAGAMTLAILTVVRRFQARRTGSSDEGTKPQP